jgi:sialidase-1
VATVRNGSSTMSGTVLLAVVCVCLAGAVNGQQAYAVHADSAYHSVRGGLKNSRLAFTGRKMGRVAFLGGSITENPGWRDSICAYLQRRFPATRFEFIPAGISSTGSTPGAFRLQADVLNKGPVDLLFEEAAVNDATNGFTEREQIRGMEGIVRHARIANPMMDIVLMHFVDPDKMISYNKGIEPTEIRTHEAVAAWYNIPSVNLAREVTERIGHGEFTWEGDFKDLHPSPFGQHLYYRSIRRLLEECWSDVDLHSSPVASPLPAPIDTFSYFHGGYVDIHTAVIVNNWTLIDTWKPDDGTGVRKGFSDVPVLTATVPGAEMRFSFDGTAMGICVAAGKDAGIVEYSVDGGPFMKKDLFTQWSKWLHLPWYYVLESELSARRHTITIRMSAEKNPESTGHACRIVHFLVNGM